MSSFLYHVYINGHVLLSPPSINYLPDFSATLTLTDLFHRHTYMTEAASKLFFHYSDVAPKMHERSFVVPLTCQDVKTTPSNMVSETGPADDDDRHKT
jgi:hypothetical protein